MENREKEKNRMNTDIPVEIEKELKRLQRRGKILTLVVIAVLPLILALGIKWGQVYQYNYFPSASASITANEAVLISKQGYQVSKPECCDSQTHISIMDPLSAIRIKGLIFYQQKYKESGVKAEVTDYGCHIQCDIIKDGQVIRSFTYRNGQFLEI